MLTLRQLWDLADPLMFGLLGIAPAGPSTRGEHVVRWLAEGRHGQMLYLADHAAVRLDPRRLVGEARSIVCVADAYPQSLPHRADETQQLAGGRIARYAWGDDYHKVLKKRLHRLCDLLIDRLPGETFRACVDTAPILEREHAAAAGLGWTGKNTMLIHPRHGSYLLLGAIVTTADLTTSLAQGWPGPLGPPTDHCGHCRKCIDACPTGCIHDADIDGVRSLDARRCISYLTIEHRDVIDPSLHSAMGDWIAGCDICQEVCPFNEAATRRPLPVPLRYRPRPPGPRVALLQVLDWTEDDRRAAVQGSALKRIKLPMWKRNALIAAGNALAAGTAGTAADELRQRIAHLRDDPDEPPLVRTTAEQVANRLDR